MREFPVSVKAVILRSGRAVLLRNERGEWELPGGRLESGETPEGCLRREIREELSLEVEVGPLLDAWVYPVLPGREVFVVVYGCRDGGGKALRSDEHGAAGWFTPEDAARIALPAAYLRAMRWWASGGEP